MRLPTVAMLVVVLLCPSVALASDVAPVSDVFRVTVPRANIRATASSDAPVLVTVSEDAGLPVVGREGQWIKVQATDNDGRPVLGYIMGSLGLLERTLDATGRPGVEPERVAARAPTASVTDISMPRSTAPLDFGVPPSAAGPRQDSTGRARDDWNGRLERAKNRRKTGTRLVLYGLGVAVGGSILAATVINGSDSLDGLEGGSNIGIWTGLAGSALIGWGGFKWFGAKEEIGDLDREGRSKGYLAVVPRHGGAIVQARMTF